jgi:hypothetical protein
MISHGSQALKKQHDSYNFQPDVLTNLPSAALPVCQDKLSV